MAAKLTRLDSIPLLTRYYDAFNRNENQAMLDCMSGDVAHDINQGSRQTGKAAFAEFLAHMDRCYSERLTDIVLMASEDGTRASAEFVVGGRLGPKKQHADRHKDAGQTGPVVVMVP